MKNHLNGWYVYTHSVSGKVFYIGKGRGGRALDTDRNARWLAVVKEHGSYDVHILAWYPTSREACEAERSLLQCNSPKGNIILPRKRTVSKHKKQ